MDWDDFGKPSGTFGRVTGDRGLGKVGSDWECLIVFSILETFFWSDFLDVLGVFIDTMPFL